MKKKVIAYKKGFSEIDKYLKEGETLERDIEKNVYQVEDRLNKIVLNMGHLNDIEAFTSVITDLKDFIKKKSEQLEEPKHKLRLYIGSELARRLNERGFKVLGKLPELKVGILTLEFLLSQSKVKIWYGPRIEMLKQCELALDDIVKTVLAVYEELNTERFKDEDAFLGLLFEAYRTLIRKEGKEIGANMPIIVWLSEIAWQKQDKRFINDPRREHFKGYGRTQFSYDLFQLKSREYRNLEIKLVIASREQTKHKEDNLWIPYNPRGEGTHFAYVCFRERA